MTKSEIESVYDSRDSYKPCTDEYHSSGSNLPLQSSENSNKPNFIRNQPHQSRKRERGKVIVKHRSLIVIIHYVKMITQR